MKRLQFIIFALMAPLSLCGQEMPDFGADFSVGGIYYNFLEGANEVEVTHNNLANDSYIGTVVIPETVDYNGATYTVTAIGNLAFATNSRLQEVAMPHAVTKIGNAAFLACASLRSVNIPASVTSLGEGVFTSCSSLQKITLAWDDLSTVSFDPNFLQTTNLSNCVIEIPKETYHSVYKLASPWSELSDNMLEIDPDFVVEPGRILTGYVGAGGDITIPYDVKQIGKSAFYLNSNVTSVVMQNSVTSIGFQAFSGCSELLSVTIPNSVTFFGDAAFAASLKLTEINVSYVDPRAYNYGGSITYAGGIFAFLSPLCTLNVPDGLEEAYNIYPWWYFNNIAPDITNATVDPIPDQIHTGEAIAPSVTVKDGDVELTLDTDYMVAYVDNINVGEATIYIAAKGKYKGCMELKFKILPSPFENGVVINGVRWATRNLDIGGGFVATPQDKGAHYQWGRPADGHEDVSSDITVELADGDVPNHGDYIEVLTYPADWRSTQNDALWNAGSEAAPVKTTNDPSPEGWRVPTEAEFESLLDKTKVTMAWDGDKKGYTFTDKDKPENSIFFPVTGHRQYANTIVVPTTVGYYWSSAVEPDDSRARKLFFQSGVIGVVPAYRAIAIPIRCVAMELYTVSFSSNGGSEVSSATVYEHTTVTLPDTPTKEGYTFKGWFAEATFETKWDFEADVVTQDTTLYAKWDSETNDITTVEAAPATIVGYYALSGVRLAQEPERGAYIVQYSNGTTQKVVR